jgi:hypothetical protein
MHFLHNNKQNKTKQNKQKKFLIKHLKYNLIFFFTNKPKKKKTQHHEKSKYIG